MERFCYDSAEVPLRFRHPFCVKSSGCMKSSLDKVKIVLARLALGFQNDSGTILERCRYDST